MPMTILLPSLRNMMLPTLFHRRWLEVGEREYRRRRRARSKRRRGGGGGYGGIIALIIILLLLSKC